MQRDGTRAVSAQNHILIVDDDPDIGEVLAMLLKRRGYVVDIVHDGEAAIQRLRSGPSPHIILLDIMMPGMNGWQFRAVQTQDPELRSIPVLILTADWGSVEKAASLGVVGCLRKPIELDSFFTIVERYCPPIQSTPSF